MESTQGLRWDVVVAASAAIATTTGMFVGLALLMRPAFYVQAPSSAAMAVV